MKQILKATLFVFSIGIAAADANGKLPFDPASETCAVILPNGQATQGNGKNGLCKFYDSDGNPKKLPPIPSEDHSWWNSETFYCELEDGTELYVQKDIFRIDNYTVSAFGSLYVGVKGSGPGIADQLVVKNAKAPNDKPVSLQFVSDSEGAPQFLQAHIFGGRAPAQYAIECGLI